MKEQEHVNALIMNMLYIWTHIFKTLLREDFHQPLPRDQLENPSSNIVRGLLYIYSMETFVYSTLNTATRDHDQTKILTLGPMA